MKKIALFVFNGDPMCFIHVLLNALGLPYWKICWGIRLWRATMKPDMK